MSTDRADIQPTILSIAADSGLDLIVMGGYGHSRLQRAHHGRRLPRHAAIHDRADADVALTPVEITASRLGKRVGALRRGVYAVLEHGDGAGGLGVVLNQSAGRVLIATTVVATVIESVPSLANAYGFPLGVIEWAATIIFSLGYAARLWSAAEHPLAKHGAVFGRLHFVLSFPGLVDLAAILPFLAPASSSIPISGYCSFCASYASSS